MSEPLVSIVMAAYNEEAYIKDAIESVLNQTYKNFEFIIINDGSTDQTESIIFSFNDKRIKCVKNDVNLKLIDSLNKGISLAAGKYIARMDADDICFSERLEKQVEFMEANPNIGISGAQLELFGSSKGQMNYPLTHEDIQLNLFITSSFGNNVVIFRKAILDEYSLFFPKGYLHAEDYKLWTSWITITEAANLPICYVRYRTHLNSVSVKYRALQRETRNRIRAEYFISSFENLSDSELSMRLTGKISVKRYYAIKKILKINDSLKKFDSEKFKQIIIKLWYLDSLEQVENRVSVLFKFSLILLIDISQFIKWTYLFKHYFKIRLYK